ncbi:unnamed protein product [Arctogadus glacialis]
MRLVSLLVVLLAMPVMLGVPKDPNSLRGPHRLHAGRHSSPRSGCKMRKSPGPGTNHQHHSALKDSHDRALTCDQHFHLCSLYPAGPHAACSLSGLPADNFSYPIPPHWAPEKMCQLEVRCMRSAQPHR